MDNVTQEHGGPSRLSRVRPLPKGAVMLRAPSELDGKPIVVIATSIIPKGKYANAKTGDSVQTWILRADVRPYEAIAYGHDVSICGECPMRATDGHSRACYPHEGMIDNIFQALVRGTRYSEDFSPEMFRGRVVRLGAYGDPAAASYDFWAESLRFARGWTAYTHQWRTCDPRFKRIAMASVDSPEERAEAIAAGWRTFRTRLPSEAVGRGEIECPASKAAGHRSTCDKCRLCSGKFEGTRDPRADISIEVHGWNAATSAYRKMRASR